MKLKSYKTQKLGPDDAIHPPTWPLETGKIHSTCQNTDSAAELGVFAWGAACDVFKGLDSCLGSSSQHMHRCMIHPSTCPVKIIGDFIVLVLQGGRVQTSWHGLGPGSGCGAVVV